MAATETLPLFPLAMVAFPTETVNLHIFEERYRDLVQDCERTGGPFGISPFIAEKVAQFGTYVRIERLAKTYPDGRMDIQTRAEGKYRLLSIQNPGEGVLYATGEVERLPSIDYDAPLDVGTQSLEDALLELIIQFYKMMGVRPSTELMAQRPLSYLLGHKLGLSLEQEYQLLLLDHERDRLTFLYDHLELIMPALREIERTRDRFRLNGHFQKFDPLTF